MSFVFHHVLSSIVLLWLDTVSGARGLGVRSVKQESFGFSLFGSHSVSLPRKIKCMSFRHLIEDERWKAALLRRGYHCWSYLCDCSSFSSCNFFTNGSSPLWFDGLTSLSPGQDLENEWRARADTEECVSGRFGGVSSFWVEHLKAIYCTSCILIGN